MFEFLDSDFKNLEVDRKPVLILGIGNLLLGDEGIGIHAVERMRASSPPEFVEILDGGTGSLELLYSIYGRKKVIIIDAISCDDKPGTLYRFRPEDVSLKFMPAATAHQLHLAELFHFVQKMPQQPELIIYAVVPQNTEISLELSETVHQTLDKLILMISKELDNCMIKH